MINQAHPRRDGPAVGALRDVGSRAIRRYLVPRSGHMPKVDLEFFSRQLERVITDLAVPRDDAND